MQLGEVEDREPPTAVAAAASAVPVQPRQFSARTACFYARDWAGFIAWCRSAGAAPLPAEAATVAAFLTAGSARLGPGALAPHLAAIAAEHEVNGFASPTRDPAVKAVLKAVRRAASPRRDPPLSPSKLARMIAGCPGDLAGLRDRTLLLLMQATGLGRGGSRQPRCRSQSA